MNGIIFLQLFAVTFNGTVVIFVKRKYYFAEESFENRRNLKKSVPKKQSCNTGRYYRGWMLHYIEIHGRYVH